MSMLDDLIGETITDGRRVQDYWQLRIGEATLSIFNPIAVAGSVLGDIREIQGRRLLHVDENDSAITLVFDGGVSARVDLTGNHQVGPEAMVLSRQDGSEVVWR